MIFFNISPTLAPAARAYLFGEAKPTHQYRDICLIVKKLDRSDTANMDILNARDIMYKKLINLGLDIRVRQGTPSGPYEGMAFVLIGASEKILEKEADDIGLEKEIKKKYKDPRVPMENFSGYAEYSTQLRDLFQGGTETFFTSLERQRILYHLIERPGPNAVDLDWLVKEQVISDYFSMPSSKAKNELIENWVDGTLFEPAPLDRIRDYFGEKVAFYFAFMRTYTVHLAWLSLFSAVIFISQMAVASRSDPVTVDNSAVPAFAIIVSVWTAVFGEAWKRRQNVLAFVWNVQDFEEEEPPRPEFVRSSEVVRTEGMYTGRGFVDLTEKDIKPVPKALVFDRNRYLQRIATGVAVTVLMIICAVLGTLGIMAAKLLMTVEWDPLWGPWIGSAINFVFIQAMNLIWRQVSIWLNGWELHRTDTDYEDALIIKSFAFLFINSYISLFYIAFVQGTGLVLFGLRTRDGQPLPDGCAQGDCMNLLFVQLLVILTAQQIGRFFLALVPMILSKWRQLKIIRREDKPVDKSGQIEHIEMEAALEPFPGTFYEYSEMAIQYGYVTMFAVAFPIGALLCLVNNIFERKSDAVKLVKHSRRPRYRGAEDIGTWEDIFAFVGNVAVITNLLLLVFTSKAVRGALTRAFNGDAGAVVFLVAIEHLIFAARAIIAYIIPDVPFWVDAAKARHELWLKMETAKRTGDQVQLKGVDYEAPKDDPSQPAVTVIDDTREDGSDVGLDDDYLANAAVSVRV